VEALGTDTNKPKSKNVLDILTPREGRLDAARVKESAAIAFLADFHAAYKDVVHAQATAAATASGVQPIPATPTFTIDKKVLKGKLPEPRDGWKDAKEKNAQSAS
jgi:hypothetical protein